MDIPSEMIVGENSVREDDDSDESRTNKLRRVLMRITELTDMAREADHHLFKELHETIRNLVYTENMFVALVEETDPEWVSFPYFCDTEDEDWTQRVNTGQFKKGLTGYVLRTAKPLFATGVEIERMQADGLLAVSGKMPIDWLGIPFGQEDEVFGVLVVQSYLQEKMYSQSDKELMLFVARHVSSMLQNKRARNTLQRVNQNLDVMVQQRTEELEHQQKVQLTLYHISDLAHSGLNLEEMYAEIHRIVSTLMYAENFYIATVNDSHDRLDFPYFVDSTDTKKSYASRKVNKNIGLTDYIITSSQSLIISKKHQKPDDLVFQGEPPRSWLGVPLLQSEKSVGAVCVQSYDNDEAFNEADMELLIYVARHIQSAVQRKKSADAVAQAHVDLEGAYDALEQRVKDRTFELQKVNENLNSLLKEKEAAVSMQKVLYKIADMTVAADNMSELYKGIHETVKSLVYAENFIIALYESEKENMVSFAYHVDVEDDFTDQRFESQEFMDTTLTGHVMKTGKVFYATRESAQELKKNGIINWLGSDMVEWFGVPLKHGDKVLGAMVVQSYVEDQGYSEADKDLLLFVSQHIANAVIRKRVEQAVKRNNEELEERVELRTKELTAVNDSMLGEIKERQRVEEIQTALFKISELSATTDNLYDFYKSLHELTRGLMYADNFFVATVDELNNALTFPYVVDEHEDSLENWTVRLDKDPSEPLSKTEKVVLSKQPVLTYSHDKKPDQVFEYGHDSVAWLGVPLIDGDKAIGALVVQSYTEGVIFTEKDMELLSYISQHIATTLKRRADSDSLKQAHEELRLANTQLEQRVEERTQALKAAQKQLTESAHRAGMSEIATGVLHNIGNLLNSVATSANALEHLKGNSKLESLVKANLLVTENESNLVSFIAEDPKGRKVLNLYQKITEHLLSREEQMGEQLQVIRKCCKVMAEVVNAQQKHAKGATYKEEVRLAELVEDALAMKSADIFKHGVRLSKDFSVNPVLSIEKSKILNVLVNLIKNSIEAMAEAEPQERVLSMSSLMMGGAVVLEVADKGYGVPAENIDKIFNHGFTTKSFGHGFGLHSCANAMKENDGSITVSSKGEGEGTVFTLTFNSFVE